MHMPVRGDGRAQLRERTLHETEMQGAHDILMTFGHPAERALMQVDLVTAALGEGLSPSGGPASAASRACRSMS